MMLCEFVMIVTLLYYIASCEFVQNGSSIEMLNFQTKCTVEECSKVTCDSINEDEFSLVDHIKVIEEGLCDGITLDILKTEFKGSMLPENWLSTLNIKIGTLTIQDCGITGVSENAFDSPPFASTNILTITNSNIQVIKRNMFNGLRSVTNLALRSYNHIFELEIGEEALEGLSSLAVLEINRYTFTTASIINLTGVRGAHLSKLLLLDLGHNTIEQLVANAFQKVPNVQRVFLHNSAIKHIDQRTFSASLEITTLNLANNSLETLTNGTFANLTKLLNAGLHLSGNNWDCKCPLQWLKDYYLKFNIINNDTPLMCSQGLPFEEMEFCLELTEIVTDPDSSTSHISSSSASTDNSQTQITTHGSLQESYTTIKCEAQDPNSNVSLDAQTNSVRSVELLIKNELAILEFKEIDADGLSVMIVVKNIVLKPEDHYFLLWFNSNNKSEYDCICASTNTLQIGSLNYDTTYTFSLLRGNETEISPKSTFGLTTQLEWKDRGWILNKSKVAVLTLTGVCVLFVTFLTALFTFICVNKHRKVTNDRTSVQVVCGKCCGDDAKSNDYERPAYWEPYVTPSSHGYLTPKHNKYDKIHHPPTVSRSTSEWSVHTPSTTYANTNYRDRWNNSQFSVQKRENFQNFRLSHLHDFRPPLPPPNPY